MPEQMTFLALAQPWAVCPKCDGEKTGFGCDRCDGNGVVPSADAPAWMQRMIREHRRYRDALEEILSFRDEVPDGIFSHGFYKNLIDIAQEALDG
jgi:gamma-glutamyl:cysteine ligase YbdK (ATP-grasp superfamily)